MLETWNSILIHCPAVVPNSNNPLAGYRLVLVPGAGMKLARKDDVGWNRPPERVIALDYYCPLAVAWLNRFAFPTALCARNDYLRQYNTYSRANLVEVVRVLVLDAVLLLHRANKPELIADNLRIFVEGLADGRMLESVEF